MSKKTIAVLTSGGDAPGMNAAIRAVARTGLTSGMRVLGIRLGYNGLSERDPTELVPRSVSAIIILGGTMLYQAQHHTFNSTEGVRQAAT